MHERAHYGRREARREGTFEEGEGRVNGPSYDHGRRRSFDRQRGQDRRHDHDDRGLQAPRLSIPPSKVRTSRLGPKDLRAL